jgi:hypothetical protein
MMRPGDRQIQWKIPFAKMASIYHASARASQALSAPTIAVSSVARQ